MSPQTLDQHRRAVELAEALEAAADAYKDHQQTIKGSHDERTEGLCRRARHIVADERRALAGAERAITFAARVP